MGKPSRNLYYLCKLTQMSTRIKTLFLITILIGSIITLLNAKTTLAWGVAYLGLYNVMFVLLLIAILLAAGNRATAKAWARWERVHALQIRLWYGLIMVGLGTAMLWWVLR